MRQDNIDFWRRCCRLTREQADRRYARGEMTDRDYRRYLRLWTFGASRFGGAAAMAQEEYAQARGYAALCDRRDRIGRVMVKLASAGGMVG